MVQVNKNQMNNKSGLGNLQDLDNENVFLVEKILDKRYRE